MTERFEIFTVLINRINRNIRRIKNQEMAEYDLRSAHVSCLYYLYLGENLTASELCERCEEDKATISRALEHLKTNGFLVCDCTGGKRYKAPLVLTDKGKSVGKKIAEKIDAVLNELSTGLTEAERVAFYHSLTIISDTLEQCSTNKKGNV